MNDIERLLEDYKNGHLNEQTLEKAIVNIAKHEAQQESGRVFGFLVAIALLGWLAWQGIPQSPPLNPPTGGTQGETFEEFNVGRIPRKGDRIAGYPVTSPHGDRVSPCLGCSSNHPAVDVGTPIGTALYTPVAGKMECRNYGGLSGLVGEMAIDSVKLQYLHLRSCISGNYQAGEKFGSTGMAGTGAHLDIRAKNSDGTRPKLRTDLIKKSLKP